MNSIPMMVPPQGVVEIQYDVRTPDGVPSMWNFATYASQWIQTNPVFDDSIECGISFRLENWQTSQPRGWDDYKIIFQSYTGNISEHVGYFEEGTYYRCTMKFDFVANQLTFRVMKIATSTVVAERTYDNVLGTYPLNYLDLCGSNDDEVQYDRVIVPRIVTQWPPKRLYIMKDDTREFGYYTTDNGAINGWKKVGVIPTGFTMMPSGDFNCDGQEDVVLRRDSDKLIGWWRVEDGVIKSWTVFTKPPLGWELEGFGDFNADGTSDMLIRRTSDNQMGAWLLNGSTIVGWRSITRIPTGWKVLATDDFDRDGQTDIVLVEPATTTVGVWYMDGSTVRSWKRISSMPAGWVCHGLVDFNNDHRPDLFMARASDRRIGGWLLNDNLIIGWRSTGAYPAGWSILGTAR